MTIVHVILFYYIEAPDGQSHWWQDPPITYILRALKHFFLILSIYQKTRNFPVSTVLPDRWLPSATSIRFFQSQNLFSLKGFLHVFPTFHVNHYLLLISVFSLIQLRIWIYMEATDNDNASDDSDLQNTFPLLHLCTSLQLIYN